MARNHMKLEFAALSQNEAFARVAVAAFISQLDPDMEELTEIKTVVSEAVTNAIIHGYEGKEGNVSVSVMIDGVTVEIVIEDFGSGIEDIDQAREPLYTSKPELERSGMGFTIMENFMDEVEVTSEPGKGTRLRLLKTLQSVQVFEQ